MKCVLIIPPWNPCDIFPGKTVASQINYWQPLGLLYIGAVIQKAGHEVRFLDGGFFSIEKIVTSMAAWKPEFAGIYSTTFGWEGALDMALHIKSIDPSTFITVGGPYPSAVQEKCLSDSAHIDAVVFGEGESTVTEILVRLADKRDLNGIKGVAYKKSGEIHKNEERSFIADLDTIPFPDRDLLGEKKSYIPPPGTYRKKPVALMITSRGCNRNCIFCFQIDKKREYGIRYRSIENVLKEIKLCARQGFKEIKFIDDTFTSDYDRALHLAKEIKKLDLKLAWFASACVNQVDTKLLKVFKEAGCWAILLGVESGVQKNLNTLRKRSTLKQIKKAVHSAKMAKLKVFTPFIFGIPGETFNEGLQTIDFACELNPDVATFNALTPFPGTYLYDNIERYGRKSPDLSSYTYQGTAFVPYTMTKTEINTLRRIAFRKFYSRPVFLLKRLLDLRTLRDLKVAMTGIKSLFWLWITNDLFSSIQSLKIKKVNPKQKKKSSV